MSLRITLIAVVCLSFTATIFANEWRQFRGPNGQGHIDAKNLPTTWSESENIVWKTKIPGRGWSSPVFAGPTIWLTTAVEYPLTEKEQAEARAKKLAKNPLAKEMSLLSSVELRAVGFDAVTGDIKQNIELFKLTELDPIHSLNSFASPSPVLDGNLLYCHFGELGTACVDSESNTIVWKKQLPSKHSVGPGSSPIVSGDLFIVPCDGTEQQYVIALNKLTGEQVWKTKRPPLSGEVDEMHKSFSTPLQVTVNGREQVIIPGAQWVVAYDPRDGYEIWKVRYGDGFSNVPRPVVGHGMAYICTGFMSPQLWAIGLDGQGDVSQTHVKFKVTKQIPAMPSPVLVNDQLYYVSDQGVVTCVNALTGDQIWTRRISGKYSSSPLYADGKLYFLSQEGKTTVLKPGRDYVEVAVNQLDGQLMASLVVLNESLLLRSQTHLYRIGKK